MKIMILNSSGNVGKSFLSRELFYYNMQNNCDEIAFIEIETHNSASDIFEIKTIKLSGKDINTLYKQLLMNECVIIDVGASNIISFLETLIKNNIDNILEEIDYFIIPVNSNSKIQDDTLKLLLTLTQLNFPKEKIKLIFNAVDNINEVKDFIEKANEIINIDTNLIIPNFNYLNKIEKTGFTAYQLANSKKDYKALAKEAYKKGDIELGDKYANLSLMQGSAKKITQTLNNLYNYLKTDNA